MKRLLLVFAILAPLAVLAGLLLLRSSLPKRGGSVPLDGLASPVEVIYERYGMPHVYAATETDLMRVTGYLHAQERLWQMDLMRRAVYGRLSEILGPVTVDLDRRFRVLALWRGAEADIEKLDPSLRLRLDAYVSGVNSYLSRLGAFRPPEFLLLQYRPEPWTLRDSLSITKLMAYRLSGNMDAELLRAKLERVFGAQMAAEVFGLYPAEGPSIIRPGEQFGVAQGGDGASIVGHSRAALPSALAFLLPGAKAASNSFVVDGRHSVTGKPLLANDPHLAVELPGIWYEAHLVGGGIDAIGVTIPGLPFVVIGHNREVAWGFTNLYGDCQDLFQLDVDSTNPDLYRVGQDLLRMEVEKELIHVRGSSDPIRVHRRWTIYGPVVTPDVCDYPATLALSWTVYQGGRISAAFDGMNRAGDFDRFRRAVSLFDVPSQNIIYADKTGNIGYLPGGRFPLDRTYDGLKPAPGWDPNARWKRYSDDSDSPYLFNPQNGHVVTANNRVIEDPRWVYSREYESVFRPSRIEQLVCARERHDFASLASIQADVHSNESERYRPVWEAHATKAEGKERAAAGMLLEWDGNLDGDAASALYETFRLTLEELALKDDLQDLYDEFMLNLGERDAGATALLRAPASRWWDNRATPAVETMDDIVSQALVRAWDTLLAQDGASDHWRWDRMHTLTLGHPLGSGGRALAKLFNRGPYPFCGDGETLNNSDYTYGSPFAVAAIASWRVVMDASDWDASRSVLPAGQSGHPLAANYADQTAMFLRGAYKPLAFTRSAVEKVRVSTLRFVPAPGL